jgi:hypothetical protein
MPPRPKHLPTYFERSALQSLSSREWIYEASPWSTGPGTVAGLIEKGWIEPVPDRTSGSRKLRITQAGRDALKIPIPVKR